VPEQLAAEVVRGSLVRVPLGAREVDGVVESVATEPDANGGELKPVLEVTGRLPEPLLDLAIWIAEGTASTLARAVALVVPPSPNIRSNTARGLFSIGSGVFGLRHEIVFV